MEHSTDHTGRLFIDRDPVLFGVLLQFMRASTCPPQHFIKRNREALLEECKFFSADHVRDRLHGYTSIYDLRLPDRNIKLQEADVRASLELHPGFLMNVFESDTTPLESRDLEVPLLRASRKRATVNCCDYDTFLTRFRALTHGLMDAVSAITGVVFAGGAVTGTLTETPIGDVDIFLTCSLHEAPDVLAKIYNAIQTIDDATKTEKGSKLLITRSKHAVTIFRVHDGKLAALPIQIILTLYESVTLLLASFDLDSSAVAYLPGKGVFCTPRSLRALKHSVNVFDSDMEGALFSYAQQLVLESVVSVLDSRKRTNKYRPGPTYCQRLEKWDARGWRIGIPGFVDQKVSRRVRDGLYYALTKSGLLLHGERPNVLPMHAQAGGNDGRGHHDGMIQRCRVLQGFQCLWAN